MSIHRTFTEVHSKFPATDQNAQVYYRAPQGDCDERSELVIIEEEPNDTIGQANPMVDIEEEEEEKEEIGSAAVGEIDRVGDVDHYVVSVGGGVFVNGVMIGLVAT